MEGLTEALVYQEMLLLFPGRQDVVERACRTAQKYLDPYLLRERFADDIDYSDVFQTAMIAALKILEGEEPEYVVIREREAYNYTVVKNALVDIMRYHRRTLDRGRKVTLEDAATLSREEEEVYGAAYSQLTLDQFQHTLPLEEREVFVCIREGMSQTKVATTLGKGDAYVSRRVRNIRIKMRQYAIEHHVPEWLEKRHGKYLRKADQD